MNIFRAQEKDARKISSIVSVSNRDVAEKFNLSFENAPKHPSYCTPEWVLSDFERGQEYFLYIEGERTKGCVAFEQPDPDTAYLNRLSVLPECRHQGIGAALVSYLLGHARQNGCRVVSIGIIADHAQLEGWYSGLGFTETGIQEYDHLPFSVKYMQYKLK